MAGQKGLAVLFQVVGVPKSVGVFNTGERRTGADEWVGQRIDGVLELKPCNYQGSRLLGGAGIGF
jgi:hypothetical protein